MTRPVETYFRFYGDWCHAKDTSNYGYPHVTGYVYELGIYARNCVFCGKRLTEETERGYILSHDIDT